MYIISGKTLPKNGNYAFKNGNIKKSYGFFLLLLLFSLNLSLLSSFP